MSLATKYELPEKYRSGDNFRVLASKICSLLKKDLKKYETLIQKQENEGLNQTEKKFRDWYEELFTRLLLYWAQYGPDYVVRLETSKVVLTDPDQKIEAWRKYRGVSEPLPNKERVADICGFFETHYWITRIPLDVTKSVIDHIQNSPTSLSNFLSTDKELEKLYTESKVAVSALKYTLINLVLTLNHAYIIPVFFYNKTALFTCGSGILTFRKKDFEQEGVGGLFDIIVETFTRTRESDIVTETEWGVIFRSRNKAKDVALYSNLSLNPDETIAVIKLTGSIEEKMLLYEALFGIFITSIDSKKQCGLMIPSRITSRRGYRNEKVRKLFTIELGNDETDELDSSVFFNVIGLPNNSYLIDINKQKPLLMSICTLDSISKFSSRPGRIEKWKNVVSYTLIPNYKLGKSESTELSALGWASPLFDRYTKMTERGLSKSDLPTETIINFTLEGKYVEFGKYYFTDRLFCEESLYFLWVDDPYQFNEIQKELNNE